MSAFDDVLRSLQTEDYPEKVQLLHFLLHNLKQIKRLRPDDQDAVTAYVCWEIDEMLAALPAVEDYRRTAHLGCPDCYSVFARELDPTAEQSDTPAEEESPAVTRARLQQELQKAVEQEDYERAAALRDQIKTLPDSCE